MIIWNEPDKNGKDKVCKASRQQAIEMQKACAERNGFTYENDEEALADFIALHWAREEES
jgi:hypothetical protein